MTVISLEKWTFSKTLENLDPQKINHTLLLALVKEAVPHLNVFLPPKRSGFCHEAFLYVDLYCALRGLAPKPATIDLNILFRKIGYYFQRTGNLFLAEGSKQRRAVPDQPQMSRFEKDLSQDPEGAEKFGNLVFQALLRYSRREGYISKTATLIVDYTDDSCPKNKSDPFCFGSKEGKFHHRTLTFSLVAGQTHLIIATYRIKKKQCRIPLFEAVIKMLQEEEFQIDLALVDREFYRKDLLLVFMNAHMSVILPGRNCTETKRKIDLYLHGQGGRVCKFRFKVKYVKKKGWTTLNLGMVLEAKRGHPLPATLLGIRHGTLSYKDAQKRVFPLLVLQGSKKRLKHLQGNEAYIRNLYRERWAIEVAFREMHLLGIANWIGSRSNRLFRFNCRCWVYNLWQISIAKLAVEHPGDPPLTLDEFRGRLHQNRAQDRGTHPEMLGSPLVAL